MTQITKQLVVPIYYKEIAFCETCHDELKYNGVKLLSNPPLYEHECEWCGKIEKLNEIYPKITIEYKEQ